MKKGSVIFCFFYYFIFNQVSLKKGGCSHTCIGSVGSLGVVYCWVPLEVVCAESGVVVAAIVEAVVWHVAIPLEVAGVLGLAWK